MGPRSSFVMQLSRPFPSQRNAISDCEDPKVCGALIALAVWGIVSRLCVALLML